MINFKSSLLFLLFAGFFISCECVTNINTPKYIEPTEFAYVLLVNAMPDIDSVSLLSSDRVIAEGLKFDKTTIDYIKIASGLNSLRIVNNLDSSVVFNSMVEWEKDTNYTVFAYGTASRINLLSLKDGINPFVNTNAYVRFIHLSPDAPDVSFSYDNYPVDIQLAYKSYSQFTPVPAGKFNFFVKNDSTGAVLVRLDSINFDAGYKYSMVLKGYLNPPHKNLLRCEIIKIPL